MVLPVDNPLFAPATDEQFRARMLDYIRTHFADVLGKDARLLDQPNGLDLIQDKVKARLAAHGMASMTSRKAA